MPNTPLPIITISWAGTHLVKAQYPWLRKIHIEKSTPYLATELVRLQNPKGEFIGMGMPSVEGPISFRIWSQEEELFSKQTVIAKVRQAFERRKQFQQANSFTFDAYRIIHGEADQLPGLFVDRYAEHLVLQTSTAFMNHHKQSLAQWLSDEFKISHVICRDDGSMRQVENLVREKNVVLGDEKTSVLFHDADSLMQADLLHDGKTGSFLDQQENHRCAFTYAKDYKGEALDICTYHGGFALALARAGLQVTAIDENVSAIEQAKKNAALNQLNINFSVQNAFSYLRELEAAKRRFSVIVLDPPALAKRGRQHATKQNSFIQAERAYKELNLRAMRLLAPHGILISCSCSGSLSASSFEKILVEASQDAGRMMHILERRFAAHDHPVLLGLSETDYLKCWILRAVT